ncbi:hypothetical protein EV183_003260 [Coemansia sp. RSA 2336]|nr:hypothetical protein EV183_003260 [Coemansia sp. RSA 2336]
MNATEVVKISGTGAGTGIRAATDIAKESGLAEAGGYPLVSDWNDPRYIGHGVGHRDPKTGEPVPAHIHLAADGEANPQNYISTIAVEDDPEAERQLVRDAFTDRYGNKRASLYRANAYQVLGKLETLVGSIQTGEKHTERARLEHAAYNVDHSDIHFR